MITHFLIFYNIEVKKKIKKQYKDWKKMITRTVGK